MNGVYANCLRSFAIEGLYGVGSFEVNGTSAPTAAQLVALRGLPFSVAYSATGIYTITFDPSRFKLPKRAVLCRAHLDGPLADYAGVTVLANELHLPACRIQLQLHRTGVAQAPPASGSYVSFEFFGENSTGA